MVRARLAASGTLALAVFAASGPAPAAAASEAANCAQNRWVASWIANPTDGSTVTSTIAERTLRMVVRPTLGGSRVRLRFSNHYGAAPALIGPVSVAKRDYGATLQRRTLRQVLFDGAGTATIRAHGEIVSDPVDFTFNAFDELAVSVYVPRSITNPTEHFITRQANYMTPSGAGDRSADDSGASFLPAWGAYSNGWFLLDGLDVIAPGPAGAVVTFGDSITDGFQGLGTALTENFSGFSSNARYPDFLATRIAAGGRGAPLSVVNAGISGNQLLAEPSGGLEFGAKGVDRFERDALDVPGVADVLILIGTNDVGHDIAPIKVINGLRKLIVAAHARGVRVLLGTLVPFGGTRTSSTGHTYDTAANKSREAVNNWIRTGGEADSVVDFDAALRDTLDPSRMRTAYDSSDHLHPSTAGYRAMASWIDLDQFKGRLCAAVPVPRGHTALTLAARLIGKRTLRSSGRLTRPRGMACPRSSVEVKMLSAGRTAAKRRASLGGNCRYAVSLTVPRWAGRVLSVRAAFAGTSTLLPARRAVLVRRAKTT